MLIGVAVGDLIKRFALAAVRDIMSTKPDLWNSGQLRDLAHELAASPIDWRMVSTANAQAFTTVCSGSIRTTAAATVGSSSK